MFTENNREPGVIGFNPEKITLHAKNLVSRLIEACVKTYMQTQYFELIDTAKIKKDLTDIIKGALIYKEDIKVECNLLGESTVLIDVSLDAIETHFKVSTSDGEINF